MAQIICVTNNKGGVGKTNISVNLPVFLADKGKKVLLVDFDHQANATFSLGINPKNLALSIYHAITGQITPQALIQKTNYVGYDLLPSSPDLAAAGIEMVNLEDRELRLRQVLEKIKDPYDYVIIDSPPSLGLLTINALCASDKVLIPVQCEYLALEGLEQLLSTIDLVRNNLEQNLEIAGAVLTMYNRMNRVSRDVAKEIKRNFSGHVFDAIIPRSTDLSEAPKFKQTILERAPDSKAAMAFRELAQEILDLENIASIKNYETNTGQGD